MSTFDHEKMLQAACAYVVTVSAYVVTVSAIVITVCCADLI